MRVAFSNRGFYIVLADGKGHVTRINSDDTIHFEYDEAEVKVTKVLTPSAEVPTAVKTAIYGAIRKHKQAQRLANEVTALAEE